MPPAKTPKTAKTASGPKKSAPAKSTGKTSEPRKTVAPRKAPVARKPAEARKSAKNSASAAKAAPATAKYKTAAKRRPGRRKAARGRGGLKLFLRAFALVLILGGGLLYALAPRGLDLLGLAATDASLGVPAGNAAATYTSGQEPPTTQPEDILSPPPPEVDTSAAEAALSEIALENSIVRIDEILRRAMEQQGLSHGGPRLVDVLPSTAGQTSFLFQVLNFSASGDKTEQEAVVGHLIAELADTLPKMRPPAAIATTAPGRWTIAVSGVPTHELIYQPLDDENADSAAAGAPSGTGAGTAPSDAGIAPGPPGRLLIVIDDIGESLNAAKELLALNFPVTLSIWPRSGQARACAELAHAAGREVMIHQPMEPLGLPRKPPGPDAVLVRMSDADIRAVVAANLKLVPYAVGLNNHMGSKATQDRRAMRDVLDALHGRGLFVLDSLTHGRSVFYTLARAAGFPALKRDIFLDNVQSVQSITHQLNAAARLAVKRGWAIAIGHPYPQTIAALRAWQSSRPENVRIVTAKELLGKD